MGEASAPIDVLDFQFKLHCRLKVFENDSHDTFSKPCNLVSVASRFGLLFVGTSQPRFQVIDVESLQSYSVKDGDVKNYKRRYIVLPSIPQHLSVNCDSSRLCVILVKDGCTKAVIYDVASFLKQQVTIVQEIQLSATPGVTVVDLCWNPTIPSILTVCKDDGSLGLYELKGSGFEVHELAATTGATCLCWSPKGKQIVVGTKDGKLTQFKPDLTVAKSINGPSLPNNPYAISLQWISNYQFIAVYKIDGPEPQFNLFVVDAPKGGAVNFANYDDVCYSYGTNRPPQFYMLQQPTWNILLVASSNSTEVGVLGFEKDKWNQWILNDSARAELPLSASKQDTLPVGLALDTSSTRGIPWGENTLPPAPFLLLLSHHGVLCCFDTVNLKPGVQQICSRPEPLPDKSGLVAFTNVDDSAPQAAPPTSVVKPTHVAEPPQQQPQPQAPPQQFPMFSSTPAVIGGPQTTNPPGSIAMPNVMSANRMPNVPFNAKPSPVTSQQTFSLGGTTLQQASQQFSNKSFFGGQNLAQKPAEITPVIPQVPTSTSKEPRLELPKTVVTLAPQEVKQAVSQVKVGGGPAEAVMTPKDGITGINEETEALVAHMIAEQCSMLDIEVKMVVQQGSSIKVDVGSDKEATSIVESTTALQNFLSEMNEISNSQVAEVHTLKQNLIQTWAWYEEARSRFATYKDPTLRTLILAQPLDAASERRLEEIRRLIYYLDSELTQANAALDDQWETFQDSCKKRFSIKIPSIEAIYQAMVKQNATLQKQVYILKDISMRIRAKMRNVNTPRLLYNLENTAELEEQLKNLEVEPKNLLHVRYERVLKRQKRVTQTRAEKLKENFLNGNVLHVTVNKPQISSSVLNMTGLGSVPFSPIAPNRKMAPQKLDFVQSTPLPQEVSALSRVPVSKSPVATSLFTDTKSAVPSFAGGDVKTSAFVPTNAMKQSTLGTQQKAFSFVTPQVTAAQILKPVTQASSMFSSLQEVTTKPSMFSSAPPTAISTAGLDASKASIAASVPSKPTQKSLFDSTPNFKLGGINVPPGVSISFVKKEIEETPKTSVLPKNSLFGATPASFGGATTTTASSVFGSASFPNFGSLAKDVNVSGSVSETLATGNATSAKPSLFGPGTLFGQPSGNLTFIQPTVTSSEPEKIVSKPPITSLTTTETSVATTTKTSTILVKTPESTSSTPSFGVKSVETSEPTTSSSILGQAKSSMSIFGGTSTIFGQSGGTSIFAKAASPFGQSTVSSTASVEAISTSVPATTAITTTTSIFGAAPQQKETPTLFGQVSAPVSDVKTTTGLIFGATGTTAAQSTTVLGSIVPQSTITTSSAFVQGGTTPAQSTPTISSIFGTTAPQSTTTSLTFGQTQTTVAQTTSSMFGQSGITAPQITGTNASQITATTSSVFGQPGTGTAQTTILGAITPQTTAPPQPQAAPTIFGQSPSTTSTSQTTIFAQPSAVSSPPFGQTTASSTIFGQSVVTTTTTTAQAPTTSTSVFGQPVSTTSAFGQPPAFGQAPAASPFAQTSTAATPFGQNASTSASSVFGQTTIFGKAATGFGQPALSTSSSVFGQPSSSTTSSVFGQTTASTASGVFGQPASSTTGVFEQPASSVAPAFGQSAGFGSNSIFNTATSKSGSIFGGSSPFGATPTSSSAFGSSPFGAAPVFGAPATSSPPFGATNTFGTTPISNATSGFGLNKPTFGGTAFGSDNLLNFSALSTGTPATTTSSGFGTGFNQPSNVFGGGSVFGGSQPQTSTASIFGGSSPFSKPSPAFGAPPAFGGTSPGAFGQQPAFGQPAFGSTGGNAFGSPSQPGPFSGGSQTVSQSGFGAGAAFQKPAGFGSPPAFGSPGFGAAPSFGSPAFGGAPAFGSPNKVFGGPGGETGFGAAATQQQNSTFANLATQPTVGFGNLAQQSPTQTSQPSFSGGSSFSTWR